MILTGIELTRCGNHFLEGITEAERGRLPQAASRGETTLIGLSHASPNKQQTIVFWSLGHLQRVNGGSQRRDPDRPIATSSDSCHLQVSTGSLSHPCAYSLKRSQGNTADVIIRILQAQRVEGQA